MARVDFLNIADQELKRLDASGGSKRHEQVIQQIQPQRNGSVTIGGKAFLVFNSNDYLGMRFNPRLSEVEHEASIKFGCGPGGVRFISGTTEIHKELEQAIAAFHNRQDALVYSSAFAANLAILSSLAKGQSKDSLISDNVLIISDELNHRSIVDGIRLTGLSPDNKKIFKHKNLADLARLLQENIGLFDRCLVITDGIFSMLGEAQNLLDLRGVIDQFDGSYPEGVWMLVDDSHGVGAYGKTGRGVEEKFGCHADILVGTFGKAFGVDGGYVVGDKTLIDYLREASSTYIYSNPVSPGTAAATLESLKIVSGPLGSQALKRLNANIQLFKDLVAKESIRLAAESDHPIQPILIGDAQKTVSLKESLFKNQILVTNINYPVVPKGQDELRIQLSALHDESAITKLVTRLKTQFHTANFYLLI